MTVHSNETGVCLVMVRKAQSSNYLDANNINNYDNQISNIWKSITDPIDSLFDL